MLYLDHAATTPPRPEVGEAMASTAASGLGNSSGAHAAARRAKNALEEARERVAAVLGCRPLEVVFTSGGTEADNLAVQGAALANGRSGGIVTSAVEHEAVLESARFLERFGCPVAVVGVDGVGAVDPDEVAASVNADTAVVSVMLANNETGLVQPVCEVVEAVKRVAPGVAVHSDAVQAMVSRHIDVDELGVDLLTLAGHKFGGPPGVGILYVRDGVALEPLLHGGGHELGRRSGTHNVVGAVGIAVAMEAAEADRDRLVAIVSEQRRAFETTLAAAVPGFRVTVGDAERLVQHAHVRIPGIRNETLLVRLDAAGVAASAASACQSGATKVSHVLRAMGIKDDEARCHVRFSFGWTTTEGDGAAAARAVLEALDGAA